MDEILGKGLGFWVIGQYLFNLATITTPLALPLALLLTGIMTFGSLGEHFELAAIKSAGVSLSRFMRPLIVFALFISFCSFLISNYLMPVMNLKTYSLLYDMRKKKPALNLEEGIFNKLFEGYSIRIGKKDKDGIKMHDIIIYETINDNFNRTVTTAKSGTILPSENGKYLVFDLSDGWRYEEGLDPQEQQQTRMHFEKWSKVFDLSKFEFERTEEELFKNNEKMMNVGQLFTMIDSMENNKKRGFQSSKNYLQKYVSFIDTNKVLNIPKQTSEWTYQESFLEFVPDTLYAQTLMYLNGQLRSSKSFLFNSVNEVYFNSKRQSKLSIELNGKFSMAVACLILFLIGAPLGGIIRKGGIGMPIVVGIIFFVIYFILSATGQKLAEEGKLPIWLGVWLSAIVLTPIALIIIYQAKNDSRLVSKEAYLRLWRKTKSLFSKSK